MRARLGAKLTRSSRSAALVAVLLTAGLTAGCGGDTEQRHVDQVFGSSHNCLYPVLEQELDETGPLKLDGGEPLVYRLTHRREVADVAATTLANSSQSQVKVVNVCLTPYTGRCILRFVRAKVAPTPPADRVAPTRTHKAWQRIREFPVPPAGDAQSPTLIASVGLAVAAADRHNCAGGASALGVVYRTEGAKKYTEVPIDWTFQPPARPQRDRKAPAKHK